MVLRLLRRKEATEDGLRHGQQRIRRRRSAGPADETAAPASRACGTEDAIARHRACANQAAVEILAHRRGQTLLAAPSERPATTQDLGIAAQLLVQQCDSPAAHHPVAFRGIDRLKGIVPVAVAIADQVCAGHEALAYRCDQLFDVRCDRIGRGALLQVVLAPPGHRLRREWRNRRSLPRSRTKPSAARRSRRHAPACPVWPSTARA